MEICHLYISPGHNYFGHHGREPDDHPIIEVPLIECVAGHGIRGDRFFDYRDDYKGQITFFALEVFDELCGALELQDCSPSLVRRNIITRDVDLNALIGRQFKVQGVQFYGTEECRPCYWMDDAIAPGAERFLKGRGGLRARILSDGRLHSGRFHPNLAAVLLAGGESLRMGADKATLHFRGKPLWQTQLDVLRGLRPTEILVSARCEPPWRPRDGRFVADAPPSRGPLSGLAAALEQARTPHVLALAIDMPFITDEYLRSLCKLTEPGRGVLPFIGKIAEPLAAIYPVEARLDLTAALRSGDFSLQHLTAHLVAAGKLRAVAVPDEAREFFRNINSPADLASVA